MDTLPPIRTSELVNFLPFNKFSVMRSTLTSMDITRTSLIDEAELGEKSLRRSNLGITVQSNKDTNKEEDYNDSFYNDYEKTTKRKPNYNFEDPDDDKSLGNSFNSTDYANNLAESSKNESILQQSSVNDDEDYDDNGKGSCTGENKTAIVTRTKISKTIENVHHKRKSICSVLKLRPLSFNSPLTLHEVFVCETIFTIF